MHAQDVFAQLQGSWTFKRQLLNHKTPNCSGQVTGKACFTPIRKHQYLFTEEGEFVTSANKILVKKQFIYAFNAQYQTITVYSSQQLKAVDQLFVLHFAENSAHSLSSHANYQCAADRYSAQYSLTNNTAPCLEIIFNVQGPNKDYQSTTTYHQLHT